MKETGSLLLTKPETRATLTEWPVNGKRTRVIIHRHVTICNVNMHDHDKGQLRDRFNTKHVKSENVSLTNLNWFIPIKAVIADRKKVVNLSF